MLRVRRLRRGRGVARGAICCKAGEGSAFEAFGLRRAVYCFRMRLSAGVIFRCGEVAHYEAYSQIVPGWWPVRHGTLSIYTTIEFGLFAIPSPSRDASIHDTKTVSHLHKTARLNLSKHGLTIQSIHARHIKPASHCNFMIHSLYCLILSYRIPFRPILQVSAIYTPNRKFCSPSQRAEPAD